MKQLIMGCVMVALVNTASATVVTFDDLPYAPFPSVQTTFIPYGYAGFEWLNWGYYDQTTYNDYYGTTISAPSTAQVAFNDNHWSNVNMGIRWLGGGTINLVGASFLSWLPVNVAQNSITIQGWNDGSLVNSFVVSLNSSGFQWNDINLNGIDEIRMYSSNSIGHFSFDNLTFVPEPSSVLLGLFASVGLTAIRRRRR